MRRKEFEVQDREQCESFLSEKHDGVLTFAGTDGWPKAVPLNYVYHREAIYFHGSKNGEKMAGLALDPKAEFVVYQAHAFIPSYFTDPYLACPATVFFRSVRIRGHVEQVTDPAEKASALHTLMGQMQPEGGHAPIDAEDERYASSLKGVAVMRLDPLEMTGKFKFGQNLSEKRRDQVVQALGERDLSNDLDTIKHIRDSALKCPIHKQ
ncbi:pyridoxamine 5'-phosphate oxidase family protein [Cohnella endophytica]|uniref:Pyridoxamine 5'-phosphate oxidase family protein n=1 Tax=Cohnella endophytica TaxID=2419778 RepID=A0A494Y0B8_9BACL|nr:pyridoxamine 5'-phosphate oxidase family protein [Cohnella endophytica]RKP56206.1 pyridoxamine 5'-phosphate oxidase family protein [Cohnella endophytica]